MVLEKTFVISNNGKLFRYRETITELASPEVIEVIDLTMEGPTDLQPSPKRKRFHEAALSAPNNSVTDFASLVSTPGTSTCNNCSLSHYRAVVPNLSTDMNISTTMDAASQNFAPLSPYTYQQSPHFPPGECYDM